MNTPSDQRPAAKPVRLRDFAASSGAVLIQSSALAEPVILAGSQADIEAFRQRAGAADSVVVYQGQELLALTRMGFISDETLAIMHETKRTFEGSRLVAYDAGPGGRASRQADEQPGQAETPTPDDEDAIDADDN